MKLCPFRDQPDESSRCAESACAWFDEYSQSCAVLLLARWFDAVTSTEDRLLVDSPVTYTIPEDDDTCSHT